MLVYDGATGQVIDVGVTRQSRQGAFQFAIGICWSCGVCDRRKMAGETQCKILANEASSTYFHVGHEEYVR